MLCESSRALHTLIAQPLERHSSAIRGERISGEREFQKNIDTTRRLCPAVMMSGKPTTYDINTPEGLRELVF